MKYLVSTIIPVFNRPKLLVEAVESVLAQTYRPIEIVIVDDGSSDGVTPEVCASLSRRHSDIIRTVRIPNGGPGAARQAGLDVACGDFIQFLDSDDLLEIDKFKSQIEVLLANPECEACYGKTRMADMYGVSDGVAIKRTGEHIETMFPSHLVSRWWSTSSPLYRRKPLELIGPWTTLRNEEDWEYECRLAKIGVKLCRVESFVSITRQHKESRLSNDGSSDPKKLADRARARELILRHALDAGIDRQSEEMKFFARSLFLLARQCAAAGLEQECENLLRLARFASTRERARGLDFVIFAIAGKVAGWTVVGKTCRLLDKLRI